MRAHTITTINRPRRKARGVVALGLGICALAIPATASASSDYSSVNSLTGGSDESSQPASGSDYSSANAITGGSSESSDSAGAPSAESAYSSLNATSGPSPSEPTVVASSPSDTADGFDWASAGIGAGTALALVAFAGAAFLTLRRRTAVSPSGASIG